MASAFRFHIFRNIGQVPAGIWNSLVPESNVLMHIPYLQSLERSEYGNLEFRYVVIYQGEDPVGVVYFQVIQLFGKDLIPFIPQGGLTFIKRAINWMAGNLLRPVLIRLQLRLLVSGNIFMTGESGFYFQSFTSKASRAELLRKAADQVISEDDSIRAVMISDLLQPHTEFDSGFDSCSFYEVKAEADMAMRLNKEWRHFNDYLNALTSKYRVRAKKVMQLSEEHNIICKDLSIDEISSNEERLHFLYQEVMSRTRFRLAVLSQEYFKIQKELFGEQYKLYAYYHGGQIIGFITCYVHQKKIDVHYCGMENEASRPTHLYQRMMYDMVKLGIGKNVQQLHFGRTAPEIKSTIGAVPTETYVYVKHLEPLFNILLMPLMVQFLKPQQYLYRNPFKNN